MLNFLKDIFNRVGLRTNMGKTVIMVQKPCCAIGSHFAEAYGLSMMGEGLTHRERLRQQVCFPKCDAELTEGFLMTHRQVQNRVRQGDLRGTPPLPE